MTEPQGPGEQPAAPPPPAAPPLPPAAPPPAAPTPPPAATPPPGQQAPQPCQAAQASATEPVPGAPGFFYAGVLYRAIAYIIDGIILGLIGFVVLIILGAIFSSGIGSFGIGWILYLVASVAISAAYFIYMWTAQRGTVGMKLLGMQVGNFPDGRTLTTDQAVRRWVALGGPFALLNAFNPLPALSALVGLLVLVYFFFLLYTTYSSPTKQGFHDKFANSVVVVAARSAT
jgi:uncharacterized RDD family membrane protein YckC